MTFHPVRRQIVKAATSLVAAGALVAPAAWPLLAAAEDSDQQSGKMPDVTPPEDLMREHGVLNRILLIYEAAMRKFAANERFDAAVITQSAQIVRQFVEDYHERNEENQIFPRFRKAGKLVDLVDTLYQQHQAGRRVTDTILHLAPRSVKPEDDRTRLTHAMQAFIAMYRPHEAREDTELFPKLRDVVSANEFDAMADDFEKDEQKKFGQDGFESMVHKVAGLERTLGINDLAKFTPA
jgi:hemerythrin-like domain-containing protein